MPVNFNDAGVVARQTDGVPVIPCERGRGLAYPAWEGACPQGSGVSVDFHEREFFSRGKNLNSRVGINKMWNSFFLEEMEKGILVC